jgi:heterodisulfide reductase subunit A
MKRKIGSAMVVGAGIAGIRAALDLAETGYGVTLIDRAGHIGGILSQLDYQFPSNGCGMCKMLPLVARDAGSQYCLRKGLFHENIEILLATEIAAISGEAGHFEVTLRQTPNPVDPERCIGCGACTAVCPVSVPDEFNAGLSLRKAIYLPVPHAVPNPFRIDPAACTGCGACVAACPTGAIQLGDRGRERFRVLVVDDELIVRDSIHAWLTDEGYTVEMAAGGREALERLSRERFQLMLLDIKMPGMDGVEVLQKAREIQPDLCVVMMTAYATVETAIEAMKAGAREYLLKPFDPDTLSDQVGRIHHQSELAEARRMETGALILCGGTDYFDPSEGKNPFAYRQNPHVLTSLEFERILSGTGPSGGRLVRPVDGKTITKIAWIQCVGSRDLQSGADFCSNVCCMYAIKEALLAREKAATINSTIFYMDLRTPGKSFQRYRDRAEREAGVRFERGRIHSVIPDPDSGDPVLAYVSQEGERRQERFDLVVLSVGQRPAAGAAQLAEIAGIELNPWGFARSAPFSLTRSSREGIFLGGAFAGLEDISEAVIRASSAALNASRVLHAGGGSLGAAPSPAPTFRDVSREAPRVGVVCCTCGGALPLTEDLSARLQQDPAVAWVAALENTCTAQGWSALTDLVKARNANRLVLAACQPYSYARKLGELAAAVGLEPALMTVVDIRSLLSAGAAAGPAPAELARVVAMGVAALKTVAPGPVASVAVVQEALVVGGGIAGMTAALGIADHGYAVNLVEQTETLGGNLNWLVSTLDDQDPRALLDETVARVQNHPRITVHTGSRVAGGYGEVGHFLTTITGPEGRTITLEHGAAILATGGSEAPTTAYGHGESAAVTTLKGMEIGLASGTIDPAGLTAVVMIQCVECREEPRNYCSRVCCPSALKHALGLKKRNPDIGVYVLYRDLMSCGFSETYYTRARQAGILFFPYSLERKPEVTIDAQGRPLVTAFEPLVGREVAISADLVVLATGIVPHLPAALVDAFGVTRDRDGFFQEAESKWRPVDALKEGVFACGLVRAPHGIPESIAEAEAAAQRTLRILGRERLPAAKVVAEVRHSLCSRCERCLDVCPYGARHLNPELDRIEVNPAMCQGCGACAAVCPNSAAIVAGFTDTRMMAVIDAALEGVS